MFWRNRDLGYISLEELALKGEGGRLWYTDSRCEIEAYSAGIGKCPDYVCDVLSILSPRVTVSRSVSLADSYLRTGSAPGAMRHRLAALAAYEARGTFNGPKVNAFSRALRGDPEAIVIDAWMYRSVGETRTTPKAYSETAHKVQLASELLGWTPSETQAAIWQGAREYVGYHTTGYAPMTFEGLTESKVVL